MDEYAPTATQQTRAFFCAHCGYNLIGSSIGDPCPECGQEFILSSGQNQRCGKAIASLVLGIMSIVTCMLYGVPGLVCGILAIKFSKDARKAVQNGMAPQFSLDFAKSGKILGVTGVSLSALMLLIMVAYFVMIFAVIGAAATRGGGGFPAPTPVPVTPAPTPIGP